MTRFALLPLLAMAACAQPGNDLPAPRLTSSHFVTSGDGMHMAVGGPVTEDHGVYIDPRCKAHEADLWAMDLLVVEVPRGSIWLRSGVHDLDGQYVRKVAPALAAALPPEFSRDRYYLRTGLFGWYRHDVELHERCHHFLDVTTGSPVFHR